METLVRVAWVALAAFHLAPAAAFVAPSVVTRLYGTSADGEIGLLLVHRGALFLAIVALCVHAAVEPGARRPASLAVAISMVGFLLVYARGGAPAGALRTIALVDAAGLLPLAVVLVAAWRAPAT